MYWLTGILGLILGIAPWIFGYSDNTVALWTSLILGAATIIVSIVEAAQGNRQQWEYWTAGVLGLIAIVAPFVFGFGNFANAMWSSDVLGILLAIFAGSKAFTLGKT